MAPVSQKQRGAMAAAKAGKSTLGIPKKVGAEFMAADKGGKLPAKAPSGGNPSSSGPPRGLQAMLAAQKKKRPAMPPAGPPQGPPGGMMGGMPGGMPGMPPDEGE